MKAQALSSLVASNLVATTLTACGEQAPSDVITDESPAAAASSHASEKALTTHLPVNRTDTPQLPEQEVHDNKAMSEARAIISKEATEQCLNDQGFKYTLYYGDPEIKAPDEVPVNPPAFYSTQSSTDNAINRRCVPHRDKPGYRGGDDPHGIKQMGDKVKSFKKPLYGSFVPGEGVQGCVLAGSNAAYGDYKRYSDLQDHIEPIAMVASFVAADRPDVLASETYRDVCFNAPVSPDERTTIAKAMDAILDGQLVPADVSCKDQADAKAECDISSCLVQMRGAAFKSAEEDLTAKNRDLVDEIVGRQERALRTWGTTGHAMRDDSLARGAPLSG